MNNFLESLKNRGTGIGSMPHKDVSAACRYILDKCPELPFWPQLAQKNPRENMLLQYAENLPCLAIDLEKKDLCFDTRANKEEALLKFYERFSEKDTEYFKISPEYASGFYEMLSSVKQHSSAYVKAQVVGPLTLLASVQDSEGKVLLYDEVLSEAIIKSLGMKAVWQVKQIQAANKAAVIFFDEPYLASFGSAFCNLSKERVFAVLNDVCGVIKEYVDVPVGVHCCGNSDWPMLLEMKLDIISFDFFGFGKYFCLYPEEIKNFINKGGFIAWGVIPTVEYQNTYAIEAFIEQFKKSLVELQRKGVDKNKLLARSLFTPSCGMGLLEEKTAEKILELTSEFAMTQF